MSIAQPAFQPTAVLICYTSASYQLLNPCSGLCLITAATVPLPATRVTVFNAWFLAAEEITNGKIVCFPVKLRLVFRRPWWS